MGLLETILTKEKPCAVSGTFTALCRAHGFLHACLLSRGGGTLFEPRAFSGYDVRSAGMAASSASFWDGMVSPGEHGTFSTESPLYAFHQFFSQGFGARVESVYVQRFNDGTDDFVLLAPRLHGEAQGKALLREACERAAKSRSIRRSSVAMRDIQGAGAFLVRIGMEKTARMAEGSAEADALLSGVLALCGPHAWAATRAKDGMVQEAVFLSLRRSGTDFKAPSAGALRELFSGEDDDRTVVRTEPTATERSVALRRTERHPTDRSVVLLGTERHPTERSSVRPENGIPADERSYASSADGGIPEVSVETEERKAIRAFFLEE